MNIKNRSAASWLRICWIFSIDQNLWGRSIESGPLEDPRVEPPKSAFEWVTPPEDAPDTAGYLELGFVEGIPKTVNGEEKKDLDLIRHVNEFAGKHGVGIIDHIEDRLVGIKSREVYEAPAALSIIEAHRDLEQLVSTRHELAFKAASRGSGPGWSTLASGWSHFALPLTASSERPRGEPQAP